MDVKGRERSGATPEPRGPLSSVPLSAEQVYHDYAPRVFHTARRMLRSDLDAEDVTQDVLLQVVRSLPAFRGEAAFPTWLHRVTVNAALLHRRRSARPELALVEILDEVPGDAGKQAVGRRWLRGPLSQLLDHEVQLLLEHAIAELPDGYREVLIGTDIEGLTNQTVADSLSLSLPALKSRLHRARLMLRAALAPHFDELMDRHLPRATATGA